MKIQKNTETVLQAAELLKKASEKRKCSFSILIIQQSLEDNLRYQIPENMILIERYESDFERQVQLLMEQVRYNQKKA